VDQVNPIRKLKFMREDSGQILLVFAFLLPLLILFIGFGIDFGFAYLTKAELAKAADAAALAGMRNLGRGQSEAEALANSEFALNYNMTSTLDVAPPTVTVGFTTDANGDPIVNVNATVAIKTFFIKLLPAYKTLNIDAVSQATRPPIILSLVLDRSGSMNDNGGSNALSPAVQDFLGYFLENTDRLAEVSFSTTATVDVPMTKTFNYQISSSLNRMSFGGATFAQGGLLDGQSQINGVSNPGANAVKVAVFFTDGWANTNQDNLQCGGGGGGGRGGGGGGGTTLVNYGGCSPVEASVGWCSGVSFLSPNNGQSVSCNASTFPDQLTGRNESLSQNTTTQTNICNDAMYRAEQLADTMRSQGITIYSIGLGDKINQSYLQELANDPASSTYDSSQPEGIAAFAPTASDLESVFQTIASKILLRLTQ
jgi:Flp pilus assembly protein TadG